MKINQVFEKGPSKIYKKDTKIGEAYVPAKGNHSIVFLRVSNGFVNLEHGNVIDINDVMEYWYEVDAEVINRGVK